MSFLRKKIKFYYFILLTSLFITFAYNLKFLKNISQEKVAKKIIEEKVTEKSQDFLVKNLKTLKIEILMQVIEKNIRIENLLIKKNI